jgi:hypothetical protein
VPDVPPTSEQLAAGIDKFKEFGELLAVDNLADGDVTKWSQIEALPVYVVIQKKAMAAHIELYNRRMDAIMKQKK